MPQRQSGCLLSKGSPSSRLVTGGFRSFLYQSGSPANIVDETMTLVRFAVAAFSGTQ